MRTRGFLHWVLTTLFVLAAIAVMVRLGFWQLDRLAQRRAFNARVLAAQAMPVLNLNENLPLSDLAAMEYREVVVEGTFLFEDEVLLRNQVWEGRLGFHVLTPLQIRGSTWAVLVDRGWIPYEEAQLPARRLAFQEQGMVTVRGIIRRGQEHPDFGGVPDPTLTPGQTRLEAWNLVNIPRIQQQTRASLLPIYIQQAPDPAWQGLPYRALPEVEISEGPHLGYAIQWFTFAAILGIGYPFYVKRQLHKTGGYPAKPMEDEDE